MVELGWVGCAAAFGIGFVALTTCYLSWQNRQRVAKG
jgi:hypothetical protein